MLVLARKIHESITIGNDITITVVAINGNKVRIGVSAPREYRVIRSEILVNTSPDDPAVEAEAGAVDPAGESGREAA